MKKISKVVTASALLFTLVNPLEVFAEGNVTNIPTTSENKVTQDVVVNATEVNGEVVFEVAAVKDTYDTVLHATVDGKIFTYNLGNLKKGQVSKVVQVAEGKDATISKENKGPKVLPNTSTVRQLVEKVVNYNNNINGKAIEAKVVYKTYELVEVNDGTPTIPVATPGDGNTNQNPSVATPGNGNNNQNPPVAAPGNGNTNPKPPVATPGNGNTNQNPPVGTPGNGNTNQNPPVGTPGNGNTTPKPPVGTPGNGNTNQNPPVGIPGNGNTNQNPPVGIPGNGNTNQNPPVATPGNGNTTPKPPVGTPGSGNTNQNPPVGTPGNGNTNQNPSVGTQPAHSEGTKINSEVTKADPGNVIVGLKGEYETPKKDAILAEINRIRKEAVDQGLADRYVPIKWSTDLEKTALVRAAEASITVLKHERLTDKGIKTAFPNTSVWYGENLAWNFRGIMEGIQQWYSEKADYINKKNGVAVTRQTGHYESLIKPELTHMGIAAFKNPKQPRGWVTVAQDFGTSGNSEALVGTYGKAVLYTEATESKLPEYKQKAELEQK